MIMSARSRAIKRAEKLTEAAIALGHMQRNAGLYIKQALVPAIIGAALDEVRRRKKQAQHAA